MYSSARTRTVCLAIVTAFALCPLAAAAQGFAADYDLLPMATGAGQGAASVRIDWKGLRIAPVAQLGGGDSGVGLSVQAGRNWFGQVGLAQAAVSTLLAGSAVEVVNLAGGYRWGDGRALSLQLSRGRGPRLGLAVNYDWPRYFVRLSYDQGLSLAPQDGIRFSAGLRF
jgi:hypothetical protein